MRGIHGDVMLLGVLCALGAGPAAAQPQVDGQWHHRLVRFERDFADARLSLESDGSRVTGSLYGMKLEGTLEGDLLRLTATGSDGDEGALEGRVRDDEIDGTIRFGEEEFGWRATRQKETTAPPRTHVFEPTGFHNLFSGAIAPALHIRPGDTVKTTTVDAGGSDAAGVTRALGGNPQTGPFYVEGALPGDTLAVTIEHLRLNRDFALSNSRILPVAVEPGYYRDAKLNDDTSVRWTLDREAGVGRLAEPTDRLKDLRVPLGPMLGCVGVAPPRDQAFLTGWPGSWGGNMDYRGVREGATVYLPVFQEGALLFVGDGHAIQGDGELNGNALETSMDVEFSVDLVRGQSTRGPRIEDEETLMASGIAGSLDAALRQATTELARWLERDYGLSADEAGIVLGTSIRYEITEVVDPQVHIVAKVSKSVLSTLR